MLSNFRFIDIQVNPDIKPNEHAVLLTAKIQNQGTEPARCFFGIRSYAVTTKLLQPYEIIDATISGTLSGTTSIIIHTGWFVSEEEYKITGTKQLTIPVLITPTLPTIPEPKKEGRNVILLLLGIALLWYLLSRKKQVS